MTINKFDFIRKNNKKRANFLIKNQLQNFLVCSKVIVSLQLELIKNDAEISILLKYDKSLSKL